jgi:2-C-methyl-D-erythritol 4-phosphate cytidylyltransferase
MKISVLIPAAGSGERLGLGPKALVKLADKTLLDWSLEAFNWADECLVALPPGVTPQGVQGVRFVEGGKNRQQSVYNLLQSAKGDLVLVHDVARPFVVRDAVNRLLEAARQSGAATLALAVPDTLVEESQGTYGPVIPRERHRLIQTPQAFSRELLWQAHQTQVAATDDAQLVMALGKPVTLVEGDRRMFKVTYPEDMVLAEALGRNWTW